MRLYTNEEEKCANERVFHNCAFAIEFFHVDCIVLPQKRRHKNVHRWKQININTICVQFRWKTWNYKRHLALLIVSLSQHIHLTQSERPNRWEARQWADDGEKWVNVTNHELHTPNAALLPNSINSCFSHRPFSAKKNAAEGNEHMHTANIYRIFKIFSKRFHHNRIPFLGIGSHTLCHCTLIPFECA